MTDKTEEDFLRLKEKNEHVSFYMQEYGDIAKLSEVNMFFEIPTPFNVAPPEEE